MPCPHGSKECQKDCPTGFKLYMNSCIKSDSIKCKDYHYEDETGKRLKSKARMKDGSGDDQTVIIILTTVVVVLIIVVCLIICCIVKLLYFPYADAFVKKTLKASRRQERGSLPFTQENLQECYFKNGLICAINVGKK
jgi:hypothetical protein